LKKKKPKFDILDGAVSLRFFLHSIIIILQYEMIEPRRTLTDTYRNNYLQNIIILILVLRNKMDESKDFFLLHYEGVSIP